MLIEPRHFEWNIGEMNERSEAADQAEAEGWHDLADLLRRHKGGLPAVDCFADEIPERCFYCGERLVIPCVFWHGASGGKLWMHRQCAKDLGENLIIDSQRPCQ